MHGAGQRRHRATSIVPGAVCLDLADDVIDNFRHGFQHAIFDAADPFRRSVGQQHVACTWLAERIAIRPHALRRVLVNLTDNALKFAGAAELNVETRSDGSLLITVMNRGPGIAEEELKQVMQPFYRVKNSRNRSTGGTGLGLAIGGALTLSHREGGGLCAELKLVLRN